MSTQNVLLHDIPRNSSFRQTMKRPIGAQLPAGASLITTSAKVTAAAKKRIKLCHIHWSFIRVFGTFLQKHNAQPLSLRALCSAGVGLLVLYCSFACITHAIHVYVVWKRLPLRNDLCRYYSNRYNMVTDIGLPQRKLTRLCFRCVLGLRHRTSRHNCKARNSR